MKLQITQTIYKTFVIIIYFVYTAFLVSCDNKQNISESVFVENKIEVIKPNIELNQFDISSILDTVRFVKLELTKNSIIGEINKVAVFEDCIYVFDKITRTLFVYNMNGKYLHKISRVGRGPGEYSQLDFFDINYKTRQIVLTDLMGYKILYYDLNGNFIFEKKIPFWVEGITPSISNGVILYANFRNNKSKLEKEYNVFYLDSMMNISKCYFPYDSKVFDNPRIKFATPQSGNFYTYNQIPHFYSKYKNIVYQATKNGLKPKYIFDFGNKTFNEEYLLKNNLEIKNYMEQGEFYELANILENDDFVIFSFYESSYRIGQFVYYSKESKNVIGGISFTVGDGNYFYTSNIATYESWIIASVEPKNLISWTKKINEKKIYLDKKYGILKKKIADEVTLDDNQVLMFYKFKKF